MPARACFHGVTALAITQTAFWCQQAARYLVLGLYL